MLILFDAICRRKMLKLMLLLWTILSIIPFILIYGGLEKNYVNNKFGVAISILLGGWLLLFFAGVILMTFALFFEKVFNFNYHLILLMLVCSFINYFFILYIAIPKLMDKYFANELEMYISTTKFFIIIILIVGFSIIINMLMPNRNNLRNMGEKDKESLRNCLDLYNCYSFEPIHIEKEDWQEKFINIEYYISKDEYKNIASDLKKEEYKDGYICHLSIPKKNAKRTLYELSMKMERKKVIWYVLYVIGIVIIEYKMIFGKNKKINNSK